MSYNYTTAEHPARQKIVVVGERPNGCAPGLAPRQPQVVSVLVMVGTSDFGHKDTTPAWYLTHNIENPIGISSMERMANLEEKSHSLLAWNLPLAQYPKLLDLVGTSTCSRFRELEHMASP